MKGWLLLLLLLAPLAPGPVAGEAGIHYQVVKRLQPGFRQPLAVAVDERGRVLLLDGIGRRLWVFSPGGEMLDRFPAMPGQEPAGHLPTDLALDDTRLYVADPAGGRVWVQGHDGSDRHFWEPEFGGAALEPSALLVAGGRLYMSDRRSHRICWAPLPPEKVAGCLGKAGTGRGEFRYPYMLAEDGAGYLLVSDVLNGRIQMLHRDGRFVGQTGRFGVVPGTLFRPNGVSVSGEGLVFVSDVYMGWVSAFRDGRFLGLLSDGRGERIRFRSPVGLAVAGDRLFVVEAGGDSLVILRRSPTRGAGAPPPVQGLPPVSRRECVLCHLTWAGGERDFRLEEAHLLPVTRPEMCFSCHHGAVRESRQWLAQGGQHPSLPAKREGKWAGDTEALAEGVPGGLPVDDSGHLRCGSCHTPHRERPPPDGEGAPVRNSWLRRDDGRSQLCTACHRPEADDGRKGDRRNHPRGVKLAPPPAPGAVGYTTNPGLEHGLPGELGRQGGRLGPGRELICESCHRVHGAGSGPLLAAPGPMQLCTACHEQAYAPDREHARKRGIHPVDMVLEEPVMLGDRKVERLGCASCHDVHGAGEGKGLLRDGFTPETLCQGCHERQHAEDRETARRRGVHPVGVKLDEPVEVAGRRVKRLQCLSCHSVHGGVAGTPALRVTDRDGKLCTVCHAHANARGRGDARRKGVHPVNLELEQPVELGGEQIGRLECGGCHRLHRGVKGSALLAEADKEGRLCPACHEREAGVADTDHDLGRLLPQQENRLHQRHGENGLCGSCHSLHRSGRPDEHLFVGAETVGTPSDGLPRDRPCLACHRKQGQAERKPIEHYRHPYRHLILRSDPKQFPLVNDKGENDAFGRIACVTCHDPHVWRPGKGGATGAVGETNQEGTVLDSFLRRSDPGGTFCSDCHGQEARFKYKYYHDRKSRGEIEDFDGLYSSMGSDSIDPQGAGD